MNRHWLCLTIGLVTACDARVVTRDAAERAVLRQVMAELGPKDSVVLLRTTYGELSCSRAPCWSDTLPPTFATALADYQARNVTPGQLSAAAATLGWKVVDSLFAIADSCHRPTFAALSQVGIDTARQVAIVTLNTRRGAGPYPGCGVAAGETLLFHRERSGTWRIVGRRGGGLS